MQVLFFKIDKLEDVKGYKKCPFIVKQSCCWKIVVRRMQGVRSIASINLHAKEKEHFLFAFDAPMTFQIRFYLTIKNLEHGCAMRRTKPMKCKIFAPQFNIMSAIGAKFPDIGRIYARISEVYNKLVYWYLSIKT